MDQIVRFLDFDVPITNCNLNCHYCYVAKNNVFKNIDKPLKFTAVGKLCAQPHCYNCHSFLTFGLIPEMRETMSQKLYENNRLYTEKDIRKVDRQYSYAC